MNCYNSQTLELLHYNNYLSYTFEKHKKYLFSFILSSMLFISSLSIQDYTSAVADQTFWKEDWRDHTQKITFQGSFYVVQTHFRWQKPKKTSWRHDIHLAILVPFLLNSSLHFSIEETSIPWENSSRKEKNLFNKQIIDHNLYSTVLYFIT